jgi:phosphonate degradation associated HDIG domain protein
MKRDREGAEMNIIDRIFALFADNGHGAYFGEAVTQTEHALQCAHLAEKSGSDNSLMAAALLHDVGHLLHGLGEDASERGINGEHEEGGARWLANYFGQAVVDPVRLHVAAKRYLCAVEPDYTTSLSSASQLSLRLQGGAFGPDDVHRFEQEPWYRSAVALRRWDDAAKIPGLAVPGLEHYRSVLESVVCHRDEG